VKGTEVRSRFIEYFKRQGHTHVPSSRLVPEGDATLLFTNSGMVQFKNVFLGVDKRPYTRATTYQKCVRAGGKHNDLENVGHTARHHTFFEMLGNFSFGDYFKKEAIHFAWDFVTNDLKIPKDKLHVTVFRDDDEAFGLWNKQEGVPSDRISRFGEKDNFWQMADTGPCGPCSEIFYDHGPENGCGKPDCKVGCSCDRFVEIWNLVFMQFNRNESGKLTPLPKPSVDTGAGLERLTAVMQKVPSNYQTDLFQDLIKAAERVSGKKYGKSEDLDVAMRVVADHCRASTFLIADGVLPSNEGRGYVLRRILRRGIRFARKLTEDHSVILPVVKQVIEMMKGFYPELSQHHDLIVTTIQGEEERFGATLDQGTALLGKALEEVKKAGKKELSGEVVFKLYDTYGFPADLTRIIANEAGIQVDETAFEKSMEKQRAQSQASWKGAQAGDDQQVLVNLASKLKPTKFLGYDSMDCEARVLALTKDAQQAVSLGAGDKGVLVVEQTTFYAEGGGQVGDQGLGHTKNAQFRVVDTKKINDVFFHFIEMIKGTLTEKDHVHLEVKSLERRATMRNHSATHLMHAALRKVLGSHVTQAGSLVDQSRTRFDFTHPKPLTNDEVSAIEALVNAEISSGHQVQTSVQPYKQAVNSGVMALFGEKYGDEVRVIRMGDFSAELCGGTHVKNTSDIRLFKIIKQGGVAAGVRRIEAITGDAAVQYLLEREKTLSEVEENLQAKDGKVLERVVKLQEQVKKLEKDLKQAMVQGQASNLDELIKNARDVKGIKVISQVLPIDDREILVQLSERVTNKLKSGVVVLIGQGEGESSPIIVSVTKDLAGKHHAGNILKSVAAVMDGKGGGRPELAQGAGPTKAKAQEAAQKVYELI